MYWLVEHPVTYTWRGVVRSNMYADLCTIANFANKQENDRG